MYCKYCGSQIPDESCFCSICGKDIRESAPVTAKAEEKKPRGAAVEETETMEETFERERIGREKEIMVFSILGLVFGLSGCLSWLGLIFSIKAKYRVNYYESIFDRTQGLATVGKVLTMIGLFMNIFITAGFVLSVLFVLVMALL